MIYKVIFGFVGAFVVFCAGGYQLGVHISSSPFRLATYVASRTEVEYDGKSIFMVFLGKDRTPYWRYDLLENRARFENYEALQRSLATRSMAAESELLLKFIGGGAVLTATGPEIAAFLMKKQGGDWRTRIATVLGGATGFSLGYRLGLDSIDYDSSEVLNYMQQAENIEITKELVFASLLSKGELRKLTNVEGGDHTELGESGCKAVKRTDCIGNVAGDRLWREMWRLRTLEKAGEALSSESGHLEGHEFIIFFM